MSRAAEHIEHVFKKVLVSVLRGAGGSLTIDGRSQHLSLLVQPKLQTMSNIWSWNCGEETKRKHGNGVVVHVSVIRPSQLPEGSTAESHQPRETQETAHIVTTLAA